MKHLSLILLSVFIVDCSHTKKEKFSAIQPLWTVKTGVTPSSFRVRLYHNVSPVLVGGRVVQGNGWDGIQSFEKHNGQLVWNYEIKGGVSSPVSVAEGVIYFGAADGFVYALQAKTGRMIWRFFTGSENTGAPVVRGKRVYFMSASQKIYALSVKNGKLLWLYSGPSLSDDFFIRGSYRPAVSRWTLYGGFYEGSVVALNIKNGRLRWKRKPVSSRALSRGLFLAGHCLLAPLFGEGLFCLNPRTGRTRWKSVGGGSDPVISGTHIYQGDRNYLYSLRKFDGKTIWKIKAKAAVTSSPYKNVLLYGLPDHGKIHAVDSKTGQSVASQPFGRGLSSSITVDQKAGEAYFFSIDGYLHKVRLIF